MIIALLYQIFIFSFCITAGFLTNALFLGFEKSQSKKIVLHFFTGLICCTLVSQWLVLWKPVQLTTTFAYVIVLTIIIILHKKESMLFFKALITRISRINLFELILYTAYTILILNYVAGPTTMDDTDSYHIQMIKWINEYGSVKGIAILHERFGFNSSWFISIAGFIPSIGKFQIYNVLNGSLSLILGYYLLSESIFALKTKSNSQCFSLIIIFALAVICWPITRGNAGNCNYDLISAIILIVLIIESQHSRSNLITELSTEWILWPTYLFTVRIINYPILILPLAMLTWLKIAKNYKLSTKLVLTSVLLVGPFIIRNVIVSGYPFYPLLNFDPFNVDWKPDSLIIKERIIEFAKYFNRVNVMYMDIEVTRKLPFPDWTLYWFRYLFKYDLPWVILGITGILHLMMRARYFLRHWGIGILIIGITLCIQLVSWFIISPDPRFIYGTLIGGSFLLLYSLFSYIKIQLLISLRFYTMALSCTLFLYFASLWLRKEDLRNPVRPFALPKPAYKKIIVDGANFYIPEKINGNWNTRCFDTPLPCLYIMDPRIHLRGKSIREGFRIE